MSEPTDYQVDYNLPDGESVEDVDKGWVKRHFNDTPTITEMLDHMEETRTIDATCLVATLRTACAALYQYQGSGVADDALQSIERGLWATAPQELWYEKKEAK